MSNLKDIEAAVSKLPLEELAKFRAWFEAFADQQWDAQIERDAKAGKLDALAAEALAAHTVGKSRQL